MKRMHLEPASPQVSRSREISPKKKLRKKAKSFVEGIARLCFGFRYKSIIIRNRPRKAELIYKIRVLGHNTVDCLTRFNNEVKKKAGEHYRLSFSGAFNPRTDREEMFIELVLFGDIIKDQIVPAEG